MKEYNYHAVDSISDVIKKYATISEFDEHRFSLKDLFVGMCYCCRDTMAYCESVGISQTRDIKKLSDIGKLVTSIND